MANLSGNPRLILELSRIIEVYDEAARGIVITNSDLLNDNIKKIIESKMKLLTSFDAGQLLSLIKQVNEWEATEDEYNNLINPEDCRDQDSHSHLVNKAKNKVAFIQTLLLNLFQEQLAQKVALLQDEYSKLSDSPEHTDMKDEISEILMKVYLSESLVVLKKLLHEKHAKLGEVVSHRLDDKYNNLKMSVLKVMRELMRQIKDASTMQEEVFVQLRNKIAGDIKAEHMDEHGNYIPLIEMKFPVVNEKLEFAVQQMHAAIRLLHSLQIPASTSLSSSEKLHEAIFRARKTLSAKRQHGKDIDLLKSHQSKTPRRLIAKFLAVLDDIFGTEFIKQKMSKSKALRGHHKFWKNEKDDVTESLKFELKESGVIASHKAKAKR